MKSESKPIDREACPECRKKGNDSSGDNLVVYDDGHKHCFSCGYNDQSGCTGEIPDKKPAPKNWTPINGEIRAIKSRRLTEETCRLFNYRIAKLNGRIVHVANYVRDGELVGQKIRDHKSKQFFVRGDMRNKPPLFGQHLWKHGGRRIVVTEGEIDAMSVSQVQDNKWPVVSVPNGAASAAQAFRDNLEFLNSYDEVVICFDNDEPGQEAAIACAELLRPGKAKIVSLPRKDANEHLVAGDVKSLMTALWSAQTYRPDGIVHSSEVEVGGDLVGEIWDWPWESMTKRLFGRRSGELVMHASGSGMGKSTVIRELIADDLSRKENVGVLMLEESTQDTLHDLMSLILNKPVKRILAARAINKKRIECGLKPLEFDVLDDLSDEEYQNAREQLNASGLYLYDHFGSLDCETLIHKMDYMVTALGCKKIYLDHISIVISGQDSGNERKDIDILMTELRQFVERTQCHVDAVCHLVKPKSRPFEEGGQISLRDFRGSGALYQLADACLGYERNQQHPDEKIANTVAVRSLKDRFGGVTGIVGALRYDKQTGRLKEVEWTIDEDGNVIFDPDDNPTKYADVFGSFSDEENAEDVI